MKKKNESEPKKNPIGYKVFNPGLQCRGYKFSDTKENVYEGKIEMCQSGFHYCPRLVDCFNYYKFSSENEVCEIEITGKIIDGDDKNVTDKFIVIRKLTWDEVLRLVNMGKDNSGHWNSGDSNSGDRNSGNSNSGHRNSGHRNSGNCNSGHRNSGTRNSGNWNSGNRNSGDWNSGTSNSGDSNSGDSNSGNRNSGDSNSGDRNSGNWNSGHWNGANNCSGIFNNKEQPFYSFNKVAKGFTMHDYYNHPAHVILCEMSQLQWKWLSEIPESEQTEEDKARDGRLVKHGYKEACAIWWGKLDKRQRDIVQTLPNFDPEVFEDITGIKI